MVVASMLISPMMGPIIALTYGMATRNAALIRLGFRNELISVGITLLMGFAIGIVHGAALSFRQKMQQ